MREFARAALARADAVVAGSEFTQRVVAELVGAEARDVRMIHYPHSVVTFAPRSGPGDGRAIGEPPSVLAVARLAHAHAYKGVDTLLMSWPRVLASVPDAQLVIVGDGDDRARLERIAARLRLGGRVRFLGRLNDADLAAAYAFATVFALPGRAAEGQGGAGEGFGLVFLEAAMRGLPTVAGRAGGSSEAIEDGITGTLVDGESTRDVADAIVRLLMDRTLARSFGRAGCDRVLRDFTPAHFSGQWGTVVAAVGDTRQTQRAAGGRS
jgi:phosphatidylinositol alpha-1,6-mannosyltransferase